MNEKLKIAVFVDYDNIEIGLKSTLQRELEMAVVLDALKERGDIVAKFAYADWGRQEGAKRQMAENAVQMVQRIPSPRGDKNGADINLALDAMEMAFTHTHINAFAIISGDSDFIPLVNKLKEYGKTIFVMGGKAFTSTILQKNCHEFISFESLLDEPQRGSSHREERRDDRGGKQPQERRQSQPRHRSAPLELSQAMPLVERALQVLDRREVTPQLGLLKSTMLQLDAAFSEKAYGASSFTDFVEKLKNAEYVNITGGEGRYVIERRGVSKAEDAALKPDEALPTLRDILETHRLQLDNGATSGDLEALMTADYPLFDWKKYGFQEFAELLNYAQDKLLVRIEPDPERGLLVHLGAEFYPPALPPEAEPEPAPLTEEPPDDQLTVLAAAEAKAAEAKAAARKSRKPRSRPAAGTGTKRTPRTASATGRRPRRKSPQPQPPPAE